MAKKAVLTMLLVLSTLSVNHATVPPVRLPMIVTTRATTSQERRYFIFFMGLFLPFVCRHASKGIPYHKTV